MLILHALLIPGILVFLSVASNHRLKTPAFKVLVSMPHKQSLQFLDLSQTNLDKKALDYIAVSLKTAPEPGLISLRLDDCSLKVPAPDVLVAEVLQHHNLPRSQLLGCVTTLHLAPNTGPQQLDVGLHPSGKAHRHDDGPSAALLDKVCPLDALQRLGALRMLDLRGNNLHNGVTYLARVLKRNRTLKVLNLSENKLDVQCLVAIAEALKLWISVGILVLILVSKIMLSSVYSSPPGSTTMSSSGAIALVEFLLQSNSLLHLNLTDNNSDIATIMALSSELKAKHTMRCLDPIYPQMTRNLPIRRAIKGLESELAKSIRQGAGLKNDDEVISKTYTPLSQVENSQAKAIADEITENVQTTTDIVLLEELLGLCNKLNSAITQLSSAPSTISPANGDASHGNPTDLSGDDTPLTPKVDKGKGQAEPEPEEPEKVSSPTFMITEFEDEDEDDNTLLGEEDQIDVPSPVVRWVTMRAKYLHTLMMSKGRKVGLKKKEGKSSEKVLSFSDLKRWRENTLASKDLRREEAIVIVLPERTVVPPATPTVVGALLILMLLKTRELGS
ncbi:hypothetical protein BDR06DRAFT_1070419 [Suillus hirtellus]|nr:hypothetical protein BDR06DRAFT_1070419 [Suillus hirtellus]